MTKEQVIQLTAFIERFEKEKPLFSLYEEMTMAPYRYGKAISDFQDVWILNGFMEINYESIRKPFSENYKQEEWYTHLSEQETMQAIQFIIRNDRFVDGFIATMIEEKVLPRLLEQLKNIHNL
jgi:hypothetical protein